MKTLISLSLLLLGLSSGAASAQVTDFNDTFDNGQNLGGWLYNAGDVIESTGGNPGGFWHQNFASTFAPQVHSTTKIVGGDWRTAGIDQISFDAVNFGMQFGAGDGYSMSIILRDTHGTSTPTDDDFVYYVGANIPLAGAGWKHFDFPVPTQDTSVLPVGWNGGHHGDATQFAKGVEWSDVISSVDRVEISWIDPTFLAFFQTWDIGLDNIELRKGGIAKVRNGLGINPMGFASTSQPKTGASWTSTVDIVTVGHMLSVVGVSAGGPVGGTVFTGSTMGELLIDPTLVVTDVSTGTHALAIPANPGLVGLTIVTQAATVDGGGVVYLQNALDVTIGA